MGIGFDLWKLSLQRLADEIGLRDLGVSLPAGDEQVEQDRASDVLANHPELARSSVGSREVIVNLIGHVRTSEGLRIKAELDTNSYPKGIKVSDQELAEVRLQRAKFHGDWNYTVLPK